jgi:predicted ATPase
MRSSVNGTMKVSNMQVVPFALTRISVKDFGPIREADVHLGKVTVLMGPNNAGKTYFTLLIPALSELVREWRFARPLMASLKFEPEEFMRYLEMKFGKIVQRLYAVNRPEDLIRRGSEEAQLRFELVELMPEGERAGEVLELEVQIGKRSGIVSRFGGPSELFESNKAPEIRSVFIPAERAGLMRTYRQLLRLYVATSWVGAPSQKRRFMQLMYDEIRIGAVKLFFDALLDMEKFTIEEREKAHVAPALDLLEREVLGGRLEMDRDFSVSFYEAGAKKPIDLINASAMVSELSAIYLLSGTLKEGWWLIVEEPEAHVHPRGQVGIARFMAMLARLGVNVIVTTHSDLIALKLAQMVGLAGLSPEERVKLGYREGEYLTKEELALYLMEPTEDGSAARKVEVSETGEVSELPTYSNVVEEMYGEAVRLLELYGEIPKVGEEP